MKQFFLVLAAALPLHAATTIEISARFADVPDGTVVTASTSKLEKMKGVNVLAAPKVVTAPGQKATIEITQVQSAPGGASVPLGVTLEITPTVAEKTIAFSGKATDRAIHGKRNDSGVSVVEFATREAYFSGATTSGDTVLIHTAPAITKSAKGETKARELVVLLNFTKKVSDPEPTKKTPVKSQGTKAPSSTKKSATSKITPPKKKK
jgi:hypothetical protein